MASSRLFPRGQICQKCFASCLEADKFQAVLLPKTPSISPPAGADRGRVVGVEAADPATVYSYNVSANKGAIWAPGGPASDGSSVFVGTGNTAGSLPPLPPLSCSEALTFISPKCPALIFVGTNHAQQSHA